MWLNKVVIALDCPFFSTLAFSTNPGWNIQLYLLLILHTLVQHYTNPLSCCQWKFHWHYLLSAKQFTDNSYQWTIHRVSVVRVSFSVDYWRLDSHLLWWRRFFSILYFFVFCTKICALFRNIFTYPEKHQGDVAL